MQFVNTVSAWFDYPGFIGRTFALCFIWHLLPGHNPLLGFVLAFTASAGLGLAEAWYNVRLQTSLEFEDDNDWENRHV
jgi:hypothetical protein